MKYFKIILLIDYVVHYGLVVIILAVIYKLRNKIDKQSLLLLYNSLFHSKLIYCAASWGSTYKHTLNRIIILQSIEMYIKTTIEI